MSSLESTIGRDGLEIVEAPVSKLIQIWLDALDSFAQVAASLNDQQWRAASPCPGWAVRDVVAHVLALESELHGDPAPKHQPNWDALPHVKSDFGQYTEIPVDWQRSKDRETVVANLLAMIELRRVDLDEIEDDRDAPAVGPAGWQTSRANMILTRIVDTWTHEQDIRHGSGLPDGPLTEAAAVTAGRFAGALPFVWGKRTGAAVGEQLALVVTEPGVPFTRIVTVGDDKRATCIQAASEPVLTVELSWPLFASLCGGRIDAVRDAEAGGAQVIGDPSRASLLFHSLAITP